MFLIFFFKKYTLIYFMKILEVSLSFIYIYRLKVGYLNGLILKEKKK